MRRFALAFAMFAVLTAPLLSAATARPAQAAPGLVVVAEEACTSSPYVCLLAVGTAVGWWIYNGGDDDLVTLSEVAKAGAEWYQGQVNAVQLMANESTHTLTLTSAGADSLQNVFSSWRMNADGVSYEASGSPWSPSDVARFTMTTLALSSELVATGDYAIPVQGTYAGGTEPCSGPVRLTLRATVPTGYGGRVDYNLMDGATDYGSPLGSLDFSGAGTGTLVGTYSGAAAAAVCAGTARLAASLWPHSSVQLMSVGLGAVETCTGMSAFEPENYCVNRSASAWVLGGASLLLPTFIPVAAEQAYPVNYPANLDDLVGVGVNNPVLPLANGTVGQLVGNAVGAPTAPTTGTLTDLDNAGWWTGLFSGIVTAIQALNNPLTLIRTGIEALTSSLPTTIADAITNAFVPTRGIQMRLDSEYDRWKNLPPFAAGAAIVAALAAAAAATNASPTDLCWHVAYGPVDDLPFCIDLDPISAPLTAGKYLLDAYVLVAVVLYLSRWYRDFISGE